MNAGSETAVDSIVGMKFAYTGENGWSASATLEGGPNLSYSKASVLRHCKVPQASPLA